MRDEKSGAIRVGFIGRNGELVIGFDRLPEKTVYVGEFHEGRAVIQLEKEGVDQPKSHRNFVWGYIDEAGRMAVPPRFDHAQDFSEGLAYVSAKGAGAFIDRDGREVFKVDAIAAKDFHEGLAAVCGREARDWGYVDRSGREVVKRQYRLAGDFSEGLAAVSLDGKYGFINRKGETVIPPRFWPRQVGYSWEGKYEMGRFSEGLAWVGAADPREAKRNLYGYINKAGDFVIRPQFVTAQEFSEGLAWVVTGVGQTETPLKAGWVDKSGRWAVEGVNGRSFSDMAEFSTYANPVFDWRYSEGLVPFVVLSGNDALHGYMDRRGAVVIPPGQFNDIGPFSGGLARVYFFEKTASGRASFGRLNEKGELAEKNYGYINKGGRFVWRYEAGRAKVSRLGDDILP